MAAIRIRRKLESETLHLPELKPLIGHEVEIIVRDESISQAGPPGRSDWDAVLAATWQLRDYDHEAQTAQDACDLKDAEVRLR